MKSHLAKAVYHKGYAVFVLFCVVLYYEADSLPLFAFAFTRLDESAQRVWLEKLYRLECGIPLVPIAIIKNRGKG